ncbi:hypothetical protein K6U06_19795 [Acidiferrimicrobium sp. IK]|uniref:hypothetical protein n=1 Tax=Acidiferrimicrobium sp. IK TaxID=2871700 RepID=UPI0021CAE364|nr:hypothetical protein [Acidiferrimicrobium sp. IK]MCU4186618.1 hypothetical protein [Acidiferrimicrobium sp. IK]
MPTPLPLRPLALRAAALAGFAVQGNYAGRRALDRLAGAIQACEAVLIRVEDETVLDDREDPILGGQGW